MDALIYFLHIPKTSGTSVSEFLRHQTGGSESLPPMLWDHLVKGTYEITHETKVVTGHFAGFLPLWLHRWPRIVTFLREPIARSLSHINHVQREASGHPWYAEARNLTIEQYCQHPVFRQSLDNLQSRYLASLSFSLALVRTSPARSSDEPPASVAFAFEESLYSLESATGLNAAALRSLNYIDAVGIAEYQSSSFQLIAKKFGWKIEIAKEYRANVAEPGQKVLESLTNSEIEMLANLNASDLQVYQKALNDFEKACEANCIPAFS